MAIHLLCLTSSGGLPIFNRKRGNTDSLPFSTVGSLNGVYLFCKSQGIELKTTYLDDGGIIVWKEFESSITLIIAARGIDENVINDLMELVFGTIVLALSLNNIIQRNNVEQLKRELKQYFPIIDKLLESIDTDLLSYTDCMSNSECGNQMLDKLTEFSIKIGSPFCCILAYHKVICGSDGWWDLHSIDRKLLITLLTSTTKIPNPPDYPVYLPKKSPNIAYRFVCVPIWQNICVCVVCGAEPYYAEIERLVHLIWNRMDYGMFETIELTYPRNFSFNIQFDQGILGVILINKSQSKYILSRNLEKFNKRSTKMCNRLDILRIFFQQAVVGTSIQTNFSHETINNKLPTLPPSPLPDNNNFILTTLSNSKSDEIYWCSDYHKCHSYQIGDNLICVLYISAIPTHTMRLITQRTLNTILSEKDIYW